MGFAIETEGLTRRFGENIAVEDFTFHVEKGQVVALLGPNGAGKTTVVRMLACLIAPSAGRAKVLGIDTRANETQIRRRVGILTERPGLLHRLSAVQNLLFFARLYGVKRPREKVDKYLGLMGLQDRGDSPVATFSKGMKQKVAVARALLHDPEILFLDEPTTGLDVVTARAIRRLIENLRTQGRTILLTTHNLDEAERLSDRIVVLDRTLQDQGSPLELRRRLFAFRLRIDLKEVRPGWIEIVRGVPGVRHVDARDSVLLVSLNDPDETTPEIVARLVRAGARIRSVTDERPPLEEVYLRILEAGKGES